MTHFLLLLFHRDRLAAMKQEAERRATLERQGHGTYTEISEGEFLEVVTKTENVVCHFYHKEFERCKIVDKHMAMLAKKYMEARFIKISAPVRIPCGRIKMSDRLYVSVGHLANDSQGFANELRSQQVAGSITMLG
eukprot:GHUV01023912.1.p1 GENE.GHUV01023912.1~~GHUV01023912.1.p1  ORF type:complete len:136 (+),score=18.68 GHUV01023912.1:213-620(+)